jgi:uncharacterized membrane protein
MNKQEFLAELQRKLKEYKYELTVIQDVLEDHQTMIEEAVERGRTEEEYIATLSTPKQIARSLKGVEKRNEKENKVVKLSPFIAIIAFFLLGFLYSAWHPAWLVFLGIPIAGVLFEADDIGEHKLVALSPFIATIAFFLIGTYNLTIWGYTFTFLDAWLVFFIIPILGLVNDKTLLGRISLIAFIVVPMIYFTLQVTNPSVYNLSLFLILAVFGPASGVIKIKMDIELGRWRESPLKIIVVAISLIIIAYAYAYLGFFYDGWHPWWVLFLLLPMVILFISNDRDRQSLVAYSPFVSIIAFILVGHYFNAYQLSWLFILAIPILGVLEDK